MIGGFAVAVHRYPRYTKDLDVSIEISEDNAEKVAKVINDFGLSSLGLTKEDFLKENYVTQLGHEPVRIDILNDLDVVSFEDAWEKRKVVTMLETPINLLDLKHY